MGVFDVLKAPAESLYTGLLTLIGYQSIKDEVTGITSTKEVTEAENIPCRISYQSIPNADQTDTVSALTQTIKLFCAPDVGIRPGSKVIVTQNGITTSYRAAGQPAVYASHQEAALVLDKEWA